MNRMLLALVGGFALAACSPPAETPGAPAPEAPASSAEAQVQRATAEGAGENIGTVTFRDGSGGALISVNLAGLPAGPHGFHIHEHATCARTRAKAARWKRTGGRAL